MMKLSNGHYLRDLLLSQAGQAVPEAVPKAAQEDRLRPLKVQSVTVQDDHHNDHKDPISRNQFLISLDQAHA